MKKVLTTIALSLSALMATSAMAAPDYRYDDRQRHQVASHQDNRWDNNRYDDNRRYQHNRYNQRVNPSRDWRSGQILPRQYSSSRFEVSHREARRLPQVNRYQQWYKVNGDYVLVNERNNRIVRIIN